MRNRPFIVTLCLVAVLAAGGCLRITGPDPPVEGAGALLPVVPPSALPDNAILEGITLNLHLQSASGHLVSLHRITGDWDEASVHWANFGGSYDPEPAASFLVDHAGWFSVDVTTQVLAWAAGEAENFGFLLRHEPLSTPRSVFPSRESATNAPFLEIRATADGEAVADSVAASADAFIWQATPYVQYGASTPLYVGWPQANPGVEMQALVRFLLPELPPGDAPDDDPAEFGCTFDRRAWFHLARHSRRPGDDVVTPLLPIWLGEPDGERSQLVKHKRVVRWVLSARHFGRRANGIAVLKAELLAVKLNVANGASDGAIAADVAAADALLSDWRVRDWYSLDAGMRAEIEALAARCRDYNRGEIGPGACEPETSLP